MTTLFKHIMVPVDFTEKNASALDAAIDIALRWESQLTLLHIIERIEQEDEDDIKDFYDQLESKARRNMETLVGRFTHRGCAMQQEIAFGRRGPEILQYSLSHNVDLIVLSSHKVPLDQPQGSLGTLSHQISILSQCPVLLVK